MLPASDIKPTAGFEPAEPATRRGTGVYISSMLSIMESM